MPKEDKPVGVVSNYFEKISVAAVKLKGSLKVGDRIRFVGGDVDCEEEVKGIQIHHKEVKTAKKGDEIGVKVGEKVRKGYKVFKV